MKVLVTGSLGLVGSATMELLRESGHEVIGIDNNNRAETLGTEPQEYSEEDLNIDIRNRDDIEWLFGLHQFDAIVHAAAQPSHDWAKDHVFEDFEINALGTLNLLEATRRRCPDATFVNVSTDKVYGERMSCGLEEIHENPLEYNLLRNTPVSDKFSKGFHESLGLDFAGKRSLFGCSKTAADIYVQEYGNYFGMKTACFRLGCITGKNHQGAELHGFLSYLAKCIKEEKPYTIFGDGKTVRDQIHANDLAAAFIAFIENPKVAAVYNMGGGPERSVSILEAIDLLEKETGKKAIIQYGEERKGDRRWDVIDVSKFRNDYPSWQYKYSLVDIIKDLCV